MPAYRVLFVCMGNICRSPTAEGIMESILRARDLGNRFDVDSAGTHAYHVGDPPDPRAVSVAATRGVDLSLQRARRVSDEDFESFDLVCAMDRENRRLLLDRCPDAYAPKVRLLLEFGPDVGRLDVPDPYYGGPGGFDQVFDLVAAACECLVDELAEGGAVHP